MIDINHSANIPVALCRCAEYERRQLKQHIAELAQAVGFTIRPGTRILLKPNLVAAAHRHDLACTHPDLVAAAAEYFIDCGAEVKVGDSPATGGALRAMAISGMTEALAGLPVKLVEFTETQSMILPCGIRLQVALEALECDALINLPKVKAHSQLRVTLAVKNYFGVVRGWRKVMAHQLYGANSGKRFLELLLELPDILPAGLSLVDGIKAMHHTGPMYGLTYHLALLAAGRNAQALDTALLEILGVKGTDSALWQEGAERKLPGTCRELISFPLDQPEELKVTDFQVPAVLVPVRFTVRHVMTSLAGRFKIFRRKHFYRH